MSTQVQLENSWKAALGREFDQPYMKSLRGFLRDEMAKKKTLYPKGSEIFAALNTTPIEKVKVVILGQDPYHGPGQAHGLCFSVRKGVRPPPSLVNIFLELKADLNIDKPSHGCLEKWAHQGVLLLNSVLSVEAGLAGSHANKGWEIFTDRIIEVLSQSDKPKAFVLWGSYAQKKGAKIDRKRHLVIESPHPSPLSSHRGFFGSRPFSKINNFLKSNGQVPIDWTL